MSKDDQSDFDPDAEYTDDEYDEYDEYEPDDEYDDEQDEEPPKRVSRAMESVRSGTQRLRGTPRPTGTGKSLSDRDAKRAIYMLNDQERLFAFIASAASAIMGVAIYVTETSNKHFRLAKGELTPQTMLLVGLAGGALLLATTLVGRRALVGFMVFFAGAAFSTKSFVFALPYWALAFWLLWRSSRIQRQARAEAAARPRSANTKSGGGRTSGSRTSGSRKPKAGSDTRAKRPEANKRYTPPRPPPKPKPAPPARRPRKTTTKND
jgi:hypothetical protein